MWRKLRLFLMKKELLLKEVLTKEQIYGEILNRVEDKKISLYDIESLYKDVLNIKYNNNTIIESQSENRDITNIEEIEAYKNMINEENYIVKIIAEKYHKETSTSNWKMNLYFLKANYADMTKDENIYIDLINSYIEGYSLVENMKDHTKIKSNKKVKYISSYLPNKAVEYALTYAFNYNTAKYPDYSNKGGDCANFISQALHAGGKPMTGTNATNFSNWFCRSNYVWDVSKISSTWRGADAFGYYWMSKAVSYKNFDKSYFSSHSNFREVLSYGHRGDAVSLLNSNGRPYHTLIIIDYNKDDLICATHSRNTITSSLRSYGFYDGARLYKMTD